MALRELQSWTPTPRQHRNQKRRPRVCARNRVFVRECHTFTQAIFTGAMRPLTCAPIYKRWTTETQDEWRNEHGERHERSDESRTTPERIRRGGVHRGDTPRR